MAELLLILTEYTQVVQQCHFYFESDIVNVQYSFDSSIKVNIYEDLFINFSDIAESMNI